MKEFVDNNIEVKPQVDYDVEVKPQIVEDIEKDIIFLQSQAKKNLIKLMKKHFDTGTLFAQNLRAYREKLKENNSLKGNPAIEYINRLDSFFAKVENYDGGEISDKMAEDFFSSKDGGFKQIAQDLYDAADDYEINTFLDQKDFRVSDFKVVLQNAINMYERNKYQSTKYLAENYGDFNIGKGDYLIEGVTKLIAGYEWVTRNGKCDLNSEEDIDSGRFRAKEIDRASEKLYSNKEIKQAYSAKGEMGDYWDDNKLEDAIKNHTEWKTYNVIHKSIVEKNKKKRAENEAIAKLKTDEKLKEFAEEEKKRSDQIISNLKGRINDDDEEEIEAEEKEEIDDYVDFVDFEINKENKKEDKKVEEKKVLTKTKQLENASDEEMAVVKQYTDAKVHELKPEEKVIVYGTAIVDTFKQFSTELKEYIKEFHKAQQNPDANVPDGIVMEGPEDYKQIMSGLYKLTDTIDKEKDGKSFNDIAIEARELFNKINKYESKHKPRFRGHRTTESAKRYSIMERLSRRKDVITNTVNSLYKEANDNIKAAKGGELSIVDTTMENLGYKVTEMYNVKNPEELKEKAKIVSSYQLYTEERAIIEKNILSNLMKQFPALNVERFYKGLDMRSDKEYFYTGNDETIRSLTTANGYDIIEAGVVKRELRKLKTENISLRELTEMEKNIKDFGLRKEINKIAECEGYYLNAEVNNIVGPGGKDKLRFSEQYATLIEKNINRSRDYVEELTNESPEKLKAGPLKRCPEINKWLVYNIAIAKTFSELENVDIMSDLISIKSEYNLKTKKDIEMTEKGLFKSPTKRIHEKLFGYINESGILKDFQKDGKNSLNNLPELMKKVDDPKFMEGFKKVFRNTCMNLRVKYQEEILYFAGKEARNRKAKIERNKKWNKQQEKEEAKRSKGMGKK